MESVADDDVAIDNFVVDVLNLVVSKMESPEDNNGKFSKISRSASVGLIPEKASYAGKSNDILINYNILKWHPSRIGPLDLQSEIVRNLIIKENGLSFACSPGPWTSRF